MMVNAAAIANPQLLLLLPLQLQLQLQLQLLLLLLLLSLLPGSHPGAIAIIYNGCLFGVRLLNRTFLPPTTTKLPTQNQNELN